MNKTKIEKITTPGERSYQLKVTNTKGETFNIPVVDSRDNEEARQAVEFIEKEGNAVKGSSYIKPSFSFFGPSYNQSMKTSKQ